MAHCHSYKIHVGRDYLFLRGFEKQNSFSSFVYKFLQPSRLETFDICDVLVVLLRLVVVNRPLFYAEPILST